MKLLTLCLVTLVSLNNLAIESDFNQSRYIEGRKFANPGEEDFGPDTSKALVPDQNSFKGGFNELLPFVVPAPDQEDAGSCLFMSHTGNIEWWMNKINKRPGTINLSERYLMNLSKADIGDELVSNWRTDTIYRINATKKNYLNRDFRFTKGHFKVVNGKRVETTEDDPEAIYGVKYNWLVKYKNIKASPIKMPKFKRNVFFEDPERNQWNVGGAPKDIVKMVKNALKRNKAPVLAIYNHNGYWHANLIVGYNDHANNDGCPFVSKYNQRMNEKADKFIEAANEIEDPKEKRRLQRKAKKYRTRGQKVEDAFVANGGCKERGVFYVRDSIYPMEGNEIYDYDPKREGEESPLNGKVILREYAWLERLSNHAYQILLDK